MTAAKAIYQHLSASTALCMDKGTDERLIKIRDYCWIDYPQANRILSKFEKLLTVPKRHRMPWIAFISDDNNGKTRLAYRFLLLHEPDLNLDGDAIIAPVMLVDAPSKPSEGQFYSNILNRIAYPYNKSDSIPVKQAYVLKQLSSIQLRVLIIDGFHNMLIGGPKKRQQILNIIKYLSNELNISIIGVGNKEVLHCIQHDPHAVSRFEQITLPKWLLNHDFITYLGNIEKELPLLYPSNLTEPCISQKLFSMSEGLLGELSDILSLAATEAILSGEEKITEKLLDRLSWIKPSQKKAVGKNVEKMKCSTCGKQLLIKLNANSPIDISPAYLEDICRKKGWYLRFDLSIFCSLTCKTKYENALTKQ